MVLKELFCFRGCIYVNNVKLIIDGMNKIIEKGLYLY